MRFTCVQIWCFLHLCGWRYVDFQTGHFADFGHFKIDSHLVVFGQVKIDPTFSFLLTLGRSVILLSLGKMLGLKKQSKLSPFNKKCKNHPLGLAQVIFNDLISLNQELGSPVNKLDLINRLQRFNLLFLSVTCFSDLCNKIKYAW